MAGPGQTIPQSGGSSGGGAFGGLPGMLLSGLGGPLGGLLGGLGGFFGAQSGLDQARGDIQGLSQFDPRGFSGAGGNLSFGQGGDANFQLTPQQQMLSQMSGGVGAQGFAGGLFNDPNFARAFQGNNIQGAFNQAQAVGNFGAGGLAGLGFGALQGAQDQSGLIQSTFDQLQGLAQPGENQAANRLLDSQFSRFGGGDTSGLAGERAQQANQFLTNADSRALQATQFGLQNQQAQRQFGLGAVGQGFGQATTAGQNRLQNSMNLFGLGSQVQGQGIQQGFQAQNAGINQMQAVLQAILGSQNAESNRIGATGQHAQALGQLGQAQGGLLGGALGSLFG